jgi:hypothetical protein
LPCKRRRESAADLIPYNFDYEDAISRIHVTPIDRNPGRIVDYTFKTVNRLKASWYDMIVLPRTIDEISNSRIDLDPRAHVQGPAIRPEPVTRVGRRSA